MRHPLWIFPWRGNHSHSLPFTPYFSFYVKRSIINLKYSLEGLMLKVKLQYFGHLMQRANSLEKTLILGKLEARRRRR